MLSMINFLDVKPVKPEDFVLDQILFKEEETKPKLLQDYSSEEKICLLKKKILAITNKKSGWTQKKVFKKEAESMWDVDLSKASQGYFDQRGNFTVEKTAFPMSSWLVKRDIHIYGPFTEREMRSKVDSGLLKDTCVKRDIDGGFVPYNDIVIDLGDFLSSERLDDYFQERVVTEENASKPQEFFDDLSSMSLNVCSKKGLDRSKILENCNRSRGFLHSRNPSITLGYLEGRITGKSFSDAIETISSCAGLRKAESEEFLNLFLDESKLSILSDVCPDGFIKVAAKPKKGHKKL